MANKRTPWNIIEKMYRAGVLSIYEIGRETNTPEANIRYHAKKHGWTRDLSDKVRAASRAKLIENLANGRALGELDPEANKEAVKFIAGRTDEQIVEEAARTQVEVVRQHQKTLGSGHSLTMRMLHELDATTTHRGELEDMIKSTIAPRRQGAVLNAISLPQRATTMRDLATAARLWISLERQAFSIVEDKEKTAGERKLDEMTADQLRAEILDDAKKLGLELTREDFGVAPAKAVNGNGRVH